MELTEIMGKDQIICGPVISVPYKTDIVNKDGKQEQWHQLQLLPDNLNIEGDMEHEIRYRGIYNVIGYVCKFNVSGNFSGLTDQINTINPADIAWDKSVLSVGITDMRGIKSKITINWNNEEYETKPGTKSNSLSQSGISTSIKFNPVLNHKFSFNLIISGSESIQFIPVGAETNVSLNSDWNTPSFSGSFLPDKKTITKTGFSSEWHVLELNRNFPQSWTDNNYYLNQGSFGVDLIQAVDIYQYEVS